MNVLVKHYNNTFLDANDNLSNVGQKIIICYLYTPLNSGIGKSYTIRERSPRATL